MQPPGSPAPLSGEAAVLLVQKSLNEAPAGHVSALLAARAVVEPLDTDRAIVADAEGSANGANDLGPSLEAPAE